MVVNIYQQYISKDVIKILQGSVVTQTVLGGLTVCHSVANFLIVYKFGKLIGSSQSYGNNKQAYFFGPPCVFCLVTNVSFLCL